VRNSWKIAVLVGLPLALSCMTQQNNGTTHGGSVVGASFSMNGYSTGASTQIEVQVLATPASDATVAANWTTLATTFSSASATNVNGDSLYYWSANVVPVPSALFSARWPDGGLVKLRAIAVTGGATYNLLTFDSESWTTCSIDEYFAGTPGQTIGTTCQGLGRNLVSLVSTLDNPADDLTSPQSAGFLGLKGVSGGTTGSYYSTWSAPLTLADFKTRYLYPGSGDVTATYYNDGDLGVGREMHCWKFVRLGGVVGTACYVSNYSDTAGTAKFGNNSVSATLSNAIAHTGEFATVAMATEKSLFGPPGDVNFVAYDASGSRVTRAQLDNANSNRHIPNNCLTCHGVDSYYDSTTYTIVGRATFLPFDLASFEYSSTAGYTRSAQEEAFRNLNKYVRDTSPPAAVTGLIDGSYPAGVTTVGATFDDDYVPTAWQTGSPREDYPTLYKGVVKKYCRTCHVSAGPSRDFAEASDFDTLKAGIMDRACGTNAVTFGYFMPHAEHPYRLFWSSGARAYLNAWGGDAAGNGCKP
jgi:hypothetical protein